MPKNIHTYREKLNALWAEMCHTVEYLIRSEGLEWVADNCSEVIEVDYNGGVFHFAGTADDVAAAVDELVRKAQRMAHNDPNYTI